MTIWLFFTRPRLARAAGSFGQPRTFGNGVRRAGAQRGRKPGCILTPTRRTVGDADRGCRIFFCSTGRVIHRDVSRLKVRPSDPTSPVCFPPTLSLTAGTRPGLRGAVTLLCHGTASTQTSTQPKGDAKGAREASIAKRLRPGLGCGRALGRILSHTHRTGCHSSCHEAHGSPIKGPCPTRA